MCLDRRFTHRRIRKLNGGFYLFEINTAEMCEVEDSKCDLNALIMVNLMVHFACQEWKNVSFFVCT